MRREQKPPSKRILLSRTTRRATRLLFFTVNKSLKCWLPHSLLAIFKPGKITKTRLYLLNKMFSDRKNDSVPSFLHIKISSAFKKKKKGGGHTFKDKLMNASENCAPNMCMHNLSKFVHTHCSGMWPIVIWSYIVACSVGFPMLSSVATQRHKKKW